MGTICFKKTKKNLINTVLHTSVQRGFILVVIIFVDFFYLFSALLGFHIYNSYRSCSKFGLLIKFGLKGRPSKINTDRSALERRIWPKKWIEGAMTWEWPRGASEIETTHRKRLKAGSFSVNTQLYEHSFQ